MCYSSSVLIVFLIIKIIILVILPIIVFVLYKIDNKQYTVVGIVNALFVLVFIILRLGSNDCVINSNISYLKNPTEEEPMYENPTTISMYESLYSTERLINSESREFYLYDISTDPIKSVPISCSKKSYMENYGAGIAAITSLVSNYNEEEVNIIEAISYLEDNGSIDCNNGFDFETIFNKLGEAFYYNVIPISKDQVDEYVEDGESVLVETINKYNEKKNFGCEKDYIIIYNKNNDSEYSIINPNDKDYSYICPSNTIGYGSIIDGDQNNNTFTLDEIDSKALRYYTIEVTE